MKDWHLFCFFSELRNDVKTLLERTEKMSQALDQIKAYAAQIDAASNAIAARIQALIDKITAGTVAPEEIAAALQPEVDKLNALGTETPAGS